MVYTDYIHVPVDHHSCLRKNKLGIDGSKPKDVVLAYEISGHSPSIMDRMILDHHVQLGNQYSTFDNNAKRALNKALQGIMVDSVFDKYREKFVNYTERVRSGNLSLHLKKELCGLDETKASVTKFLASTVSRQKETMYKTETLSTCEDICFDIK